MSFSTEQQVAAIEGRSDEGALVGSSFETSLVDLSDEQFSTAVIASAARRLNVGLRFAPTTIKPLKSRQRAFGRVAPVKYAGSIDIVLDAIDRARSGDVLVIDNKGRLYEECLDLATVLEARYVGMAGAIVWGAHRDTDQLSALDFPVFSCGAFPGEAQQTRNSHPDALSAARIGNRVATDNDSVFADSDGIVFIPSSRLGAVIDLAADIRAHELQIEARIRAGTSLREQLAFGEYITRRGADSTYTWRHHRRLVEQSR